MRTHIHGRRSWRWVGALLLGLVAPTTLAAEPTWKVPRDARIENLEALIQPGSENNEDVKAMCGGFTLTAEEVLIYLRGARTFSTEQEHEKGSWFPCVVRGSLVSGKKKQRKAVTFTISAILTARIEEPGKPTVELICEGACEERMTKIILKHQEE
ncbi:hypothetical protein OV208_38560 [Corallococcus sp. bb12-1]|uniref:hypothetical protein n=1 Tax=Corallococcus sp. bb12-1 TaxID=2996784 RepID=UPI002270573E|nr:hypothetical protein [Corallococcus sp. bb12-1]MCY1047264.1 hypothetical protein [Corallococcus sp. bb12-1]